MPYSELERQHTTRRILHALWGAQERFIGDNVQIGADVKLFPHVYIGDNTLIGDGAIIQYGAFIEHDCNIGEHCRIGTYTVLRRETNLGNYSTFGSLSASEGKNWIGNHVLVHTQCHLTSGLIVEDWAFIAPFFLSLNDPDVLHGRRHVKPFVPQAPYIKFGARIAGNVTVNPQCVIGRESLVGSASLVTRDVPDFSIVYGAPARVVDAVDEKWRLPERRYDEFRARISEEKILKIKDNLLSDWR